jgi:poly(hydroxyalkanoate) depolymerase family esterase
MLVRFTARILIERPHPLLSRSVMPKTPIRNPLKTALTLAKLDRFRSRILELRQRHQAPATEPTAPPIDKPVKTAKARTVSGTAHSDAGATAPWLLLPADRTYRLRIPEHPKNGDGIPLVVMIHGCRQSSEEFEQGTRIDALADNEGFAVLYAEQSTFANFRRCWNWFEPNTAAGDGECAIIIEMIRMARRHVKIDVSRVYLVGMSSGAALAGLIAFYHPDLIAGVAMHSGLPPLSNPSAATAMLAMRNGARIDADALAESYWEVQTELPPPLLIVHGDADTRVHESNATTTLKLWQTLFERAPNGESSTITREEKTIEASSESRGVSQIDLMRQGRIVTRSMRVHGLAHAWSGGDAALDFNDAKGPDATSQIWKFLERQVRTA